MKIRLYSVNNFLPMAGGRAKGKNSDASIDVPSIVVLKSINSRAL